jgi:hypothetical protein
VCDAAASADAEGDAVSVSWDFGDGSRADGLQARHAFEKPGTYTVKALARDALGAVGVASDEVARRGINDWKRERLIRAGADVIIPDFSGIGQLRELLFGET